MSQPAKSRSDGPRALLAVAVFVALAVGLATRLHEPAQESHPQASAAVFRFAGPTPVVQEMFRRFDVDRDSRLSAAERRRVVFDRKLEPRDYDGDGFVNRDEFEKSFRQVYDWTPSDRSLLAFRYVIEGRRLLVDGYTDSALSMARSAIQSFPEWTDNWILLGEIHSRLGQPGEALAAHRKATELSPNYAPAWLALAGSTPPHQLSTGPDNPLEKGLRLLKVKHAVFGEDPTTSIDSLSLERQLAHLAGRLLESKQPARAMDLVGWARQNLGVRPRLEGLSAMALAQAGHAEQALAELRRRAETEPDKFYYLEFRARILASMHRPMEAIESFRKALELPGMPADRRRTKLDLFIVLTDSKQQQAADKLLGEMLPEMDTPTFKIALGRILARRGNAKKALELYKSSVSAATCSPPLWIELATLHGVLGDRPGYVRTLREALEKCPGPERFRERAKGMLAAAVAGEPLPTVMPEPGSPGSGPGGAPKQPDR